MQSADNVGGVCECVGVRIDCGERGGLVGVTSLLTLVG